jgi:hypothetical protein
MSERLSKCLPDTTAHTWRGAGHHGVYGRERWQEFLGAPRLTAAAPGHYDEIRPSQHALAFEAIGPDPTAEPLRRPLDLYIGMPDPRSYPQGWTARQLIAKSFAVPIEADGPYTFAFSIDRQAAPARIDCRFLFDAD